MKKIGFCLFMILSILVFSSCNNNINSYDKGAVNNSNETDNDLKIVECIDFDTDYSLVSLNTNKEHDVNRSLFFTGLVLNQKGVTLETLKQKLVDEISSISLKYEKGIFLKSEDLVWTVQQEDSKIRFQLKICNVETDLSGELNLTSVGLESGGDIIEKKLSNYYINIYQETDNRVTFAEMPIAPKGLPDIKTSSTLVYKVMTINHDFNSSFNVNLNVPDGLSEFMEIESVSWELDNDFTEEVKETNRNELTLTEYKDLKIYSIFVTYHVKSDCNIVFQPDISIDIANVNQILSPTTPLLLIYN